MQTVHEKSMSTKRETSIGDKARVRARPNISFSIKRDCEKPFLASRMASTPVRGACFILLLNRTGPYITSTEQTSCAYYFIKIIRLSVTLTPAARPKYRRPTYRMVCAAWAWS